LFLLLIRNPFMQFLLPVLYNLGIYSAYLAGFLCLRNRSETRSLRFPRTTFFLLLAIAIPTTLQFFFPNLLPVFQRDTARIVAGELWRLVTPLFFQDGGVGGAVSNLVGLLLVGFVAEQLWDRRSMLLLFFLGGLAGELVGLIWQPVGAGNSVGNFSLAAGVAILCLLHRPSRLIQALAFLALGADAILLLLRDIHGAAALTGALLALILSRTSLRRQEALASRKEAI
jgi:membrane associated rhomboid family serine protease